MQQQAAATEVQLAVSCPFPVMTNAEPHSKQQHYNVHICNAACATRQIQAIF
jgi:hypothetical protein